MAESFLEVRKIYRYHIVQYLVSLLTYECYTIIMYKYHAIIMQRE